MPEIQFPSGDGSRATLLDRLFAKFNAQAPADRLIPAELFDRLKITHKDWQPLLAGRQAATGIRSGSTTDLTKAQTTATMYVSHYLQVFNLAVRRGEYPPADRALFGLPTSTAELPALDSEAALGTWLTNIASGDAALVAAGRPAMTNPSAAEVAAKGAAFKTQLSTRDTAVIDKSKTASELDEQRPVVDELLEDIYAELKHKHRKLAAPKWREVARTYGFRFTNHRGEDPEGRYEGALAAGELREVYEGVFDATTRLRLRNAGLTPWEIALGPDHDAFPAGRGVRLDPGQEMHCGLPELGNIANRHLLIHNLAPNQTGAWEVEFEAVG